VTLGGLRSLPFWLRLCSWDEYGRTYGTRCEPMEHRAERHPTRFHYLRRWLSRLRGEPRGADDSASEGRPWRVVNRSLHEAWQMVAVIIDDFSADRGGLMAAALAFYALLSIAPLAVVGVAVAGAVLGSGRARAQLAAMLLQSMGPNVERTVMGWVDQAASSVAAGSVIGLLLILWAASRLFGQLREALNQIWNVEVPEAASIKESIKDYLKQRLFALGMVLIAGPLLLASFISRALLSSVYDFVGASAHTLVQVGQIAASVLLVAGTTAIIFSVVPDVSVDRRSVLVGSGLTSALLSLGNYLVGLYLGRASVADTYGAAGAAVVVLLWLYYSAFIFLLGAEFTQAYAVRSGRRMKPKHRYGSDKGKTDRTRPGPNARYGRNS
jgi:membrane protein